MTMLDRRLLSSLGASQRRNSSPILRILDELCKSLEPSIVFLRTDNSECRHSLVPRSLGSEELPSLLVSTKLLFEGSAQLCGLSLLIGVDRRSFIRALLECFERGWLHGPRLMSSLARLMFTALQVLRALRLVNLFV